MYVDALIHRSGAYTHVHEHTCMYTRQVAADFGMEEAMAGVLMKLCLRWLGHLAYMESHRMPKQLLAGELQKRRLLQSWN